LDLASGVGLSHLNLPQGRSASLMNGPELF